MHPEDIKAALRKQFGSVQAFEDAHDLPRKSVSDLLRGRSSQRVREAIAKVLPKSDESELSDDSAATDVAHRLNEAAE